MTDIANVETTEEGISLVCPCCCARVLISENLKKSFEKEIRSLDFRFDRPATIADDLLDIVLDNLSIVRMEG